MYVNIEGPLYNDDINLFVSLRSNLEAFFQLNIHLVKKNMDVFTSCRADFLSKNKWNLTGIKIVCYSPIARYAEFRFWTRPTSGRTPRSVRRW
jgi:hypothetical protein